MKKLLLGIAICGIALVSCNKERTCKCTMLVDGEDSGSSTVITNEKCKNLNTSQTSDGIKVESSCVEE